MPADTACARWTRADLLCRLESLQLPAAADGQQLAKAFKKILADIDQHLSSRFQKLVEEVARGREKLDAGQDLPVPEAMDELVHDRALLMDVLLEFMWNRFDWQVKSFLFRPGIALLAVGGYGRGELHPGSDIDLLILLSTRNYTVFSDNIRDFTNLLWDLGLKVGHTVRSLNDCRSQAGSDLTIISSLMETRTLAGDPRLRDRLNSVLSSKRMWKPAEFYAAKQEEQLQRDKQWEHTGHSLEPNLKTSPGGLRDLHTIFWVAKRYYADSSVHDLIHEQFLTAEEAEILQSGRRFLWLIRYALHELAGRGEDKLSFDYQRQLAERLKYQDTDLLAVEQFMRQYYRTVTRIRNVNQLIMQFFRENHLEAAGQRTMRPVNDDFHLCNDQIEVNHDQVFEKNPSALLEMFVIMGDDGSIRGARAATLRLLRDGVRLIDEDFRRNPKNADLFISLLGSRDHLFSQLSRMSAHGILGAYLPEFGAIEGQMQFDLFHAYTVDAHTLQVVRYMRQFRYRDNRQKFPVAAHILPRLPRVELLYIAGLYHDIAKGRGGDHSKLGVQDVRAFAERHRLPEWDTGLLAWLVEHHLAMSSTAQRQDISDPEVIREFALFVGDQVHLDYLYALTVADINATNPTLWNTWRASLMWQLYTETRRALKNGLENLLDRESFIQSVRTEALQRLKESGFPNDQVLALWDGIDGEYFICEPLLHIVWHAEQILSRQGSEPLIRMQDRFHNQIDSGYTCIFIHMEDKQHFFGAVASALDQLNVSIVDAHLFFNGERKVFTTFIVLEEDGHPIGDNDKRCNEIMQRLSENLRQSEIQVRPVQRHTPHNLQQFRTATEVSARNTEHHTLVTVITPDRPGLLALVSQLFLELNVHLRSARITTMGEKVEDIFCLVDEHEKPVQDPALLEEIRTTLGRRLDEESLEPASAG